MSTKNFKNEITITSKTENLSQVRDFIKSIAETCGFTKEEIGKIILAVDEATTNVIKHAYHYADDKEINIKASCEKGKFSIVISDEGSVFDPNKIPLPDLKEYHKQKKVGGLGMFLMRKLMDDVKYEHFANRNKVTLVKYI